MSPVHAQGHTGVCTYVHGCIMCPVQGDFSKEMRNTASIMDAFSLVRYVMCRHVGKDRKLNPSRHDLNLDTLVTVVIVCFSGVLGCLSSVFI